MTFPSYPVYKESGVEWQGAVPAEWPRSALKYLADYQNGYPFKPEDWGEEGLPIIRISQLTGDTAPNYYSGELDCRVKVSDGDLLFSWSATIDSFIWAGGAAWLNQHIFKVSPTFEADKKFLFYLIKLVAPKLADFDAHGSTMRHIKKESLSERLHVPTLVEQNQVARFLDHETARIDALIEEQQRLIELLKEKRQALISHVVTKGLDPTVPMKDSGVEWLGEVPAHWVVRRIKHLTEVISKGTTPTTIGEDFQDEGIRFLKAENIFGGRVLADPEFFISERAHAALARSALAENDVLVVIAGATTGKSAVLSGDLLPANTNQAVSFIRLRDTRLSEFIQCWLSTDAVQRSISLNSVQSAQPNLSMEDLGEIPVPLPPLDEIDLITDQMATQISIFDGLISEAVNASGLLQERRSALISAAVTGKIDVRGWQPPAGTPSPESAIAEAH